MFEDESATPIVKIIDFGLCAELKDGKTSSAFVGTMTYAAPEVGLAHCVYFYLHSLFLLLFLNGLHGCPRPSSLDEGGEAGSGGC